MYAHEYVVILNLRVLIDTISVMLAIFFFLERFIYEFGRNMGIVYHNNHAN